ncbi:MAG: AbiV family abortive infection protein [Nitrospira sp.]|nr:AbiV family abortive infection protein [Nitrospira sp.]
METRKRPYRGKLSAEQIVDGMNAAIRNARRLANDAKTLLDLSRYPTAAALAILSIEENGKGGVLRNVAMAPNEEIRRKMWNSYTNHQRKNVAWILPDAIAEGARDLDSLRPIVDPTATHPALLDQYKQVALYTDCIGNAHWSEPEKIIEEDGYLEGNRVMGNAHETRLLCALETPEGSSCELFRRSERKRIMGGQ